MNTNPVKRILILAANPKNTDSLRLDEEVREIDRALRHRSEQFPVKQRWAVTYREFQLAVVEESPQIVHFCGHGMGNEGLKLEDETGQVQLVNTKALAGLFKLFADQVECVLLNACYSEVQAEVIRHHIDYVIGMNKNIGDRAAIEFAVNFYNAVGNGRGYEWAYDFARNSIEFAGIVDQADIPVLKKKPNSDASVVSTVSLWVHGWKKGNYGGSPTVELDWTQYFDIDAKPRRRIADQATWDNILLPSLVQAREQLTQERGALIIDVRGLIPLTAAVAIGTVFPDTRGYTLQILQPTAGQDNLWRSDASPSDAKFKIVQEDGEVGQNLLVALGITGDPSTGVEQLCKDSPTSFSATVYAQPESGIGVRAITCDADATALAIHAKELIRQYRRKYRASCTHLILFAPAGFCLFLGRRLRVVGDVVLYEHVADGNYQPSLKLCTG